MNWIDFKYISLLSPHLRNFSKKDQNLWNFSCPICGDSKTNLRKARGYIFEHEGKAVMKCHNCGASLSFPIFLKRVDPELFKQYNFEQFSNKYSTAPERKEKIIFRQKQDLLVLLESVCQKISHMDENNFVVSYLKNRKIPKEKLDSLYFVEDFSQMSNVFKRYKDLSSDARVIIPIKNRRGDLIGISGRAINRSLLRYINLKDTDEPLIYNLENVDFGKTVYCFEGAFDSMFVENSLAVDGSDFLKLSDFVPKNQVVVIFDNQARNREIVQKLKKTIDAGYRVVIWPSNFQKTGKDVNEIVLNDPSINIKELIDSRTFSGLRAKAEILSWKSA